jgi:hypothetical protein
VFRHRFFYDAKYLIFREKTFLLYLPMRSHIGVHVLKSDSILILPLNRVMAMPDPKDTNPSDTFSFVDKRRVADTPESYEESSLREQTQASESDAGEASEASERPAGIYDVAAYCMGLLITESFQRMGLLADPQTGKATVDLPSARVAIDCVSALAAILDEPSSTLPDPVRREMKRTLNDLRLNYIDRTRTKTEGD